MRNSNVKQRLRLSLEFAKKISMMARTEKGIQYKQNGTWVLYHRHQNKGYTKTEPYTITIADKPAHTAILTVWTEEATRLIKEFAGCVIFYYLCTAKN